MHGIFGTSLAELMGAAALRGTAVPPELAAFLALEAAEGLAPKPAVLDPCEVVITDDGRVSVFPKRSGAPEAQATRSIGALLARILASDTSLVPPALNALVNRANDPQRGYGDLATLRRDLEAVLIPLNRGAARRVLARFVRDVLSKAAPGTSAEPLPLDPAEASAQAVDELLSELELGPEKTDPHPRELPEAAPEQVGWQSDPSGEPGPTQGAPPDPFGIAEVLGQGLNVSQLDDAPTGARSAVSSEQAAVVLARNGSDTKDDEQGRPEPTPGAMPAWAPTGRRPVGPIALTIMLVVLVASGIVIVRPRWLGLSVWGAGARERSAASAKKPQAASRSTATVTIRSEPEGADVLILIGRAPVEVPSLAVGVPHELLALADGYLPARLVLPADAPWEEQRPGPGNATKRTQVRIDLQPLPSGSALASIPPTSLPEAAGASRDAPQRTVRVVTTPSGAEIFLRLASTPTQPLGNIRVDDESELLVALPAHQPVRFTVRRADWATVSGRLRLERTVTLIPDVAAASGPVAFQNGTPSHTSAEPSPSRAASPTPASDDRDETRSTVGSRHRLSNSPQPSAARITERARPRRPQALPPRPSNRIIPNNPY